MLRPVHDIAVVIPTIEPRSHLLAKALASVESQTYVPAQVIVQEDTEREGAAVTRTKGLMRSECSWTAFLDDDDQLYPRHLENLYREATTGRWDVLYSGCEVIDQDGRVVPLQEDWGRFGLDFDAGQLRDHSWLGIYSLVNTDMAQSVGGFTYPSGSGYEDWGFYLKMLEAGARFVHVPIQSYIWNHVPNTNNTGLGNTSGKTEGWNVRTIE